MRQTRLPLLLTIALLLSCAKLTAADSGSIRCQAGEGYVYLYQSADNFQVLADLKCGQKVEVVDARGSTIARVRTADGIEGYVFKAALAGIMPSSEPQPPVPPPDTKTGNTQAA
jgi:hypothetical protein